MSEGVKHDIRVNRDKFPEVMAEFEQQVFGNIFAGTIPEITEKYARHPGNHSIAPIHGDLDKGVVKLNQVLAPFVVGNR